MGTPQFWRKMVEKSHFYRGCSPPSIRFHKVHTQGNTKKTKLEITQHVPTIPLLPLAYMVYTKKQTGED